MEVCPIFLNGSKSQQTFWLCTWADQWFYPRLLKMTQGMNLFDEDATEEECQHVAEEKQGWVVANDVKQHVMFPVLGNCNHKKLGSMVRMVCVNWFFGTGSVLNCTGGSDKAARNNEGTEDKGEDGLAGAHHKSQFHQNHDAMHSVQFWFRGCMLPWQWRPHYLGHSFWGWFRLWMGTCKQRWLWIDQGHANDLEDH